MNSPAQPYSKWMPAIYANYYDLIKDAGLKLGYAIAIHGSLMNDLDLIAVPWTESCGSYLELLTAIQEVLGTRSHVSGRPYASYEVKPFSRVAFTIISGGNGYIDLSIMLRDNEINELVGNYNGGY